MSEPYIPLTVRESIDRYVSQRCPTGDSLQAILENDLKEAFGRADDNNREHMFGIVFYCYNHIPSECWGSPEKVEAWLHPEQENDKGDNNGDN